MNRIKGIVLGAGGRGQFTYGEYALKNPQDIQIIAVAEPNKERREQFVKDHKIESKNVFTDWKDVFKREKFADLVCVCTTDKMHLEPSLVALDKGYDLLLEKPISPTYEECEEIANKAKEKNASVAIAHVLRYTPFFNTIKNLIDEGKLGKVVGIDLVENIGHIHYSHSFVRGIWRNEDVSAPMILAKSCHDMDILLYLIGSDCTSLTSYGSKGYFSKKNKPKGAPHRCLEGCPVREECPYYSPKIYLTGNVDWPVNAVSNDLSAEGIKEALQTNNYGVCVFDSDNNMTEHQNVIMKFENNVNASFTMSAFTSEMTRGIKIMLEQGEIVGDMLQDQIDVVNFSTNEKFSISHVASNSYGHGGGDEGFMSDLVKHLKDKKNYPLKTSIEIALQSHKMALAAHDSMKNNKCINLKDYSK